jgi:hypothetical protein
MARVYVLICALVLGCSAAAPEDPVEPAENLAPSDEGLSGCKGKASSSIPSSGTYVITTFGGPDEPQPLACGGHSKSGTWYYAASRQRYGCGARVKITANGKCVVAQTDDYGPDVCVENAAGSPIMDVSPLVSKALFGSNSLGWSDKKKVHVELVDDSTPLGVCSSSGSGGSGGGGGSSGGGSGGAASQCSSDGECNPGNDGSGLICSSGSCIPGCHTNAQCPGVTTCVSGMCKTPGSGSGGSGGTGGSGGASSGGASSGGASSGGTSGGGGSSGGTACSNHGDCNPGSNGSGKICVNAVCVTGCTANWQCPGITTCKSGQCK